jgi:membrane-anchored mycosin MYCP
VSTRLIATISFVLAISGVVLSPSASADPPPAVDNSMLPAPASPSPPEPTEKRGDCATTKFDPGLNPIRTQLSGIDRSALWALSTGRGQRVAVIDTGVTPHRQLPHLIPGGDYVAVGDGTEDCDAHGTLVAGIISAAMTPGAGAQFSGVAPEASLITVRQSSDAYGRLEARRPGVGDVDTMAMAVRTAADQGATVINISSVACDIGKAIRDRALGAALAYAVDVKDVVVVSAAGNVGGSHQCPQQNSPASPSHPNEPDWEAAKIVVSPGWYDDYVLTVGSVDLDGNASSFTFGGPWVDVAAPGEAVVSLDPRGVGIANTRGASGTPLRGTSYAAPVVSGLVALVRSRFPDLSARQVMQRIKATARRPPGGWNPFVGNGAVDLMAAVSDRPAVPATSAPSPTQRPIAAPVDEPAADTSGRTTALTGIVGCAALLAAALALVGPARLLAGRRRRKAVMRNQGSGTSEPRAVRQQLYE